MLDDGLVVNVWIVDFNLIIDSGASCYIMRMSFWTCLKEKRIQCFILKMTSTSLLMKVKRPEDSLFIYSTRETRNILPDVEFVVIDDKGHALFVLDMAIQMAFLHIARSVSDVVNAYNRFVFPTVIIEHSEEMCS